MPGQEPAATALPQAESRKPSASKGINVNKCFFFMDVKASYSVREPGRNRPCSEGCSAECGENPSNRPSAPRTYISLDRCSESRWDKTGRYWPAGCAIRSFDTSGWAGAAQSGGDYPRSRADPSNREKAALHTQCAHVRSLQSFC